MATSSTSSVYAHVIEDVINKVRDEFIADGGPGQGVLDELQGLWELKMMQAGAMLGQIDRSGMKNAVSGGGMTPNPLHDLNVPYQGSDEYETPTADLLFPPTPLQTPMQTPLPGTVQTPLTGVAQTPLPGTAQTPGSDNGSFYNIPTGGTPMTPNEYASANNNVGASENVRAGHGKPSQYMLPPSSWLSQRPGLDVNVAYDGRQEGERRGAPHQPTTQDFFMASSGKRKREDFPKKTPDGGYIPQQDGAGDVISDELKVSPGKMHATIPQSDGPTPDPYDDVLSTPNIYNYQGAVNEDYNIANTPMPNDMQAATPAPLQTEPVDDDDEPLNENDDIEADDLSDAEDLNTTHLVLAQFDKVTRTKSRWKCTLKNGIMHLNDKDILFNKATGEFDF